MEQTAVEWLMPKVLELSLQLSLRRISQRNCELELLRVFEQAKEMVEQQKLELINEVAHHFYRAGFFEPTETRFDKYLNEYFEIKRNEGFITHKITPGNGSYTDCGLLINVDEDGEMSPRFTLYTSQVNCENCLKKQK
jgi:hypothetical protein